MRKFNVCVSNWSEYMRTRINKSIFIELPCANIDEEIAKIDIHCDSETPDIIEVDTVTNSFDCDPFKAYIEDSVARGEADIHEINSIAERLSTLSDEEIEKLELFMDANSILSADLSLAIDDFQNAKYYVADGREPLMETLLEEGYFDETFGIKFSEMPEGLKRYIDLNMLEEDTWYEFVESSSGTLFMKRGEK